MNAPEILFLRQIPLHELLLIQNANEGLTLCSIIQVKQIDKRIFGCRGE